MTRKHTNRRNYKRSYSKTYGMRMKYSENDIAHVFIISYNYAEGKVMNVDLSKFQPYNLISGAATLSITKNGLTLSKAAVQKMGTPRYAKLLINDTDKMVAFMVCEELGEGCFDFIKDPAKESTHFRLNNKELLFTLCNLMNWSTSDVAMRVNCEWIQEDGILLARLNEAEEINDGRKKMSL